VKIFITLKHTKHLFWLIYSKTDGTSDNGQNTFRIATGTVDQYSTASSANVNMTDDDDSEYEFTLDENTNYNKKFTSNHKKGPLLRL